MEIKDIIYKQNVEQSEMQFIIEQYIKVRKGVDIKCNPRQTGIRIFDIGEVTKLISFYNTAADWFIKNGY